MTTASGRAWPPRAAAACSHDAGPKGARGWPPELAERNKLPRKATLKSRKEIDRLLRSGHRQSGDYFVLVWDRSDCFRYGIFVSGRYGSAVERNRLKRLVREAVRLNQHLLTEPRVVGVLPKRGTGKLDFEQVDRDIRALFTRISGHPA